MFFVIDKYYSKNLRNILNTILKIKIYSKYHSEFGIKFGSIDIFSYLCSVKKRVLLGGEGRPLHAVRATCGSFIGGTTLFRGTRNGSAQTDISRRGTDEEIHGLLLHNKGMGCRVPIGQGAFFHHKVYIPGGTGRDGHPLEGA